MSKRRHFFMCPPAHFSIRYMINDWSRKYAAEGVDIGKALSQWADLYKEYVSIGARVEVVEPRENCYEMTFLGDSVLLHGRHAVVSNFRHRIRQKEARAMEDWARTRGFKISRLPRDVYFEGNAETITWGDKLLMGCGVRSTLAAAGHLRRILGVEVIPLELRPPFFHLDTAILPLGHGRMVFYPPAFAAESASVIRGLSSSLIEVDEEDAVALACNSMVVEGTVMMRAVFPRLRKKIEKLGFRTLVVPLSESLKVGGAIKCHTLEHYSCDDV